MKIKEIFSHLLHDHNKPQEVALGVAVGVFIGMTPLYGFHFILMVVLALLIKKANKVAIFIGTNISLPPTVPLITWGGYNVGRYILGNGYPDLTWAMFKNFSPKEFLHLYYPLFVGSVVLGLILAIFVFFFLWGILAYRRKQKLRRSADVSRAPSHFLLFFLCFLPILIFANFGHAQSSKEPLERITYKISPFGKAVYEDFGVIEENGQAFHYATFKTRAMGFDDLEKIFSDPQTLLPIRVERDIDWWKSKENLTERYDQKNFTLTIEKFIKGEKVHEYFYQKDGPIHNAITLPFFLRSMKDLKIGWTFTARVPDEYRLTLASIEKIRVPFGRFETYHFVCETAELEIWITTDELRLPVKIKGKSGAGYIMYLVDHQKK